MPADRPTPPATHDRRSLLGAAALAAGAAALAPARSARGDDEPSTGSIGKTPHTKFAVNVEMWFRALPFLDRVRQAAAHGFPAVEFWPHQGKDIDAIARLTGELGVEVAQFTAWGFSPGMNHPANEERFVTGIEEACAVAKRLRCTKMTVVAGNDQKGMSKAAMLEQVEKALRRAAPIAERHQVMLILEPMNGRVDHPGHCLYGSPDAVRICRAVDSPFVKINWDLYHMQIEEGDLCGRLKEGFDQVGYIQLADHPGRGQPGTGEIRYNRVLQEAHALGYRGYVGLECRPRGGETAAARAVAAADVW